MTLEGRVLSDPLSGPGLGHGSASSACISPGLAKSSFSKAHSHHGFCAGPSPASWSGSGGLALDTGTRPLGARISSITP